MSTCSSRTCRRVARAVRRSPTASDGVPIDFQFPRDHRTIDPLRRVLVMAAKRMCIYEMIRVSNHGDIIVIPNQHKRPINAHYRVLLSQHMALNEARIVTRVARIGHREKGEEASVNGALDSLPRECAFHSLEDAS